MAIALGCAAIGVMAFDLSFWAALLLYSVSGTAATLFVAWRRFRCIEGNEMHRQQAGHRS
ncbi:hypothetical protein [Paracoccus sp. TOH]|uniref:hypothetical protein n=1 Tax=Paracoccus sp. TOH TaxID=1263728 RepID=UPI00021757A1|nr:hypothetical protein [Paracoccus sp. TOH]WJS84604.1 hypothetical protein NBE95_02160 [Paracoccus sp. TOH]